MASRRKDAASDRARASDSRASTASAVPAATMLSNCSAGSVLPKRTSQSRCNQSCQQAVAVVAITSYGREPYAIPGRTVFSRAGMGSTPDKPDYGQQVDTIGANHVKRSQHADVDAPELQALHGSPAALQLPTAICRCGQILLPRVVADSGYPRKGR